MVDMVLVNTEGRAVDTKERILQVAERLFAEHGIFTISNRQVSEAAGQGNNTAVGYHFGSKEDLIRAIVVKHTMQLEEMRARYLQEADGSSELRDWVSCYVRPTTDYLASLGRPTWFARFSAQMLADPVLRPILSEVALATPSIVQTLAGLGECLDGLPTDVRIVRGDIARLLLTGLVAERERDYALSSTVDAATGWHRCGSDLIDAIVGVWTAPITR